MAQRHTPKRERQRRRSAGAPRRPAPTPPPVGGDVSSGGGGWSKRIAGGIGIVAALVGIAGGVRALLPADSERLITLGPVELIEGTRLAEYEARATRITSDAPAGDRGALLRFATVIAQAPDETEPETETEP